MLYESTYYGTIPLGDELYHHGVKGQKWGVRRYQNEDGSWTDAGKRHRGLGGAGDFVKRTAIKGYNRSIAGHVANMEILRRTAKSKNLKDAASNLVGNKATATRHEAKAALYEGLGKYTKNKALKTYYESQSYNHKYLQKYYNKRSSYSIGRKLATRITVDPVKLYLPMKTVRGKDSNYARECVKTIMAGAVAGTAVSAISAVVRNR